MRLKPVCFYLLLTVSSKISLAHELIAPGATQFTMQALPAVGLDNNCFNFGGVIKPAGCNFRPEKSLTARGIAGDTTRLHRLDFRKGILSPLHNHPDEEIFYILSGKFKVVSGDDTFVLEAGDILMIPAFVPHQFEALVDSSLLEVGGPGPMLGPMRSQNPGP